LMAVWPELLAVQRGLATRAVRRLDRHHRLDILQRAHRSCVAGMPQVPAALASTGPTAWLWPQDVRRITRRGPRGVLRVLVQAFQQLLDGGFERDDACFEGADILPDSQGRLLPQLRWERWCGIHGA